MKLLAKFNGIHLKAFNKVFCVLEIFGLSLWKITHGSRAKRATFSQFGFLFSIVTVVVVLCAIIVQYSKVFPGFDTAVKNNMSSLVRSLKKIEFYTLIFTVFIPVWILRKKMKSVLEKILMVNQILNEIRGSMSENLILVPLAVKICIWMIMVMTITVLEMYFGTTISNSYSHNGVTWDAFITYAIPPFFKNLCILHLITIMSLITTRMTQIQSVLDDIK